MGHPLTSQFEVIGVDGDPFVQPLVKEEKSVELRELTGRDEPSYVFSPKQSETPRRPFYVVAYRNTTQSSIKARGTDAM